MKRSYISPEYGYSTVSGLLNMREQSTFFGSKMMETPKSLLVGNANISYYQNESGEQINFDNEVIKNPVIVDMVALKIANHVIYRDLNASSEGGQISWVMEISLYEILSTYCFANIKKNRAFNGILSSDLLNNDVDLTIRDYVGYNVMNLYDLKAIDLYVSYNDLSTGLGMVGVNNFNTSIPSDATVNISNMVFNSDKSMVKIYFKQTMDYNLFSFDYFFNLNFEKI